MSSRSRLPLPAFPDPAISSELSPPRFRPLPFGVAACVVAVSTAFSLHPGLYAITVKEFLLAIFAILWLSNASPRRIAAWSAAALLLGWSASRHIESEVAHLRLLSWLSFAAILCALVGRASRETMIPALRALAAVLVIFGIDAAVEISGGDGIARTVSGVLGGAAPFGRFDLHGTGFSRVSSLIGNPNRFGAFCAIGFGLMAGGARLDPPNRALYLLGATGSVCGVVLSFSRGAWIALGTALLVLALAGISGRRKRVAALGGLAIGCAIAVAWLKTRNVAMPIDDRFLIWKAALSAIAARPLAGWGLGGFAPAFLELVERGWWGKTAANRPVLDAHGELLEVAVDLGVPAAAALIVAVAAVLGRARARIRGRRELLPFLVALAAALVAGLFSTVLRNAPNLLLIALALLVLFAREDAAGEADEAESRFAASRALTAMLLVAAILPFFLADAWFRASRAEENPVRRMEMVDVAHALRPFDPTLRYSHRSAVRGGEPSGLIALAADYPGYRDVEMLIGRFELAAGDTPSARAWFDRALGMKTTDARRLQVRGYLAGTSRPLDP